MRPRTLDELVGQEHLLAAGSALRTGVESGEPHRRSSTGRLARARRPWRGSSPGFVRRGVRGGIRGERRQGRGPRGDRTFPRAPPRERAPHRPVPGRDPPSCIKAQQDALLPAVEEGLVTLIGATTENPYFEVNPRCSRAARSTSCTSFRPTTSRRCCSARSPIRSTGSPTRPRLPGRLELLATRSGGDARTARAPWSARSRRRGQGSTRWTSPRPGRAAAEGRLVRPRGRPPLRLHLRVDQGDPRLGRRRVALLPRRDARRRRGSAVHRQADGHLRVRGRRERGPAGARGSPRPPQRRSTGSAARVRPHPPRRRRTALAPKSNASTTAISAAMRHVREHGAKLPPDYLRDSHYKGAKALGRGEGYVYPHDQPGGVADQPLLPLELRGVRFDEPTDRGLEARLRERIDELRRRFGADAGGRGPRRRLRRGWGLSRTTPPPACSSARSRRSGPRRSMASPPRSPSCSRSGRSWRRPTAGAT